MEIGIDSFAARFDDVGLAASPVDRMRELVERIERADQVGLDVFGVGEHHKREFLDSAPPVILAAAAARTRRIRLTSAVAVLSAADPVRLFQQFATLDLLSEGRAEMVVGRGSSIEAFPLFGFRLEDYDALFAEKLDLLLNIREHEHVHWSGKYRPALTGQGVYPRPAQNPLPIWLGVGGTPQSFARAGVLGLPLMVAIIGGEPRRFRPLVDLYREAGRRATLPSSSRSACTRWVMSRPRRRRRPMSSFPATRRPSPVSRRSAAGRGRRAPASMRNADRRARLSSAILSLSSTRSGTTTKRWAGSRVSHYR